MGDPCVDHLFTKMLRKIVTDVVPWEKIAENSKLSAFLRTLGSHVLRAKRLVALRQTDLARFVESARNEGGVSLSRR
eukprot:4991882-Amphidinium_carterae.1